MEGQGTNGAIFVQYDLENQVTNTITKRIDKVAADSWKVEELAGEATEPFFRPNPFGGSSVSAGSLGEDMEGQGTNSAAYVRYDAFVQYDVEGQGTNSIVKRIDKLAEEITYGGPQPSQLDGLHGWKVEKVSPDTIDPLTEDSWKVEEVSADVIDLLAGDRSSMISPGETFQAMTLPANAPPTEE